MKIKILMVGTFFFLAAASFLFAEEFYCEVLSVDGSAYRLDESGVKTLLKEGDTLKSGDAVETDKGGSVDLAYDKEWKNVQKIEENSKIKIRSVYPAKTDLNMGSVFAKLKGLPKGSSFDVQTPTAVAAVRGTEYRTSFVNGRTDVFNSSDSSVYVYGKNEQGVISDMPVVLKNAEKTHVSKLGEIPQTPQAMSAEEVKHAENLKSDIENKISNAEKSGRKAKIRDVSAMEKSPNPMPGETGDGASRVVDLRRRQFKVHSQ